jgi:hypothetical protein
MVQAFKPLWYTETHASESFRLELCRCFVESLNGGTSLLSLSAVTTLTHGAVLPNDSIKLRHNRTLLLQDSSGLLRSCPAYREMK